MDTLLISVTALSLLMAAAMAIVVMKLLRDERRRSDARVTALTEMASDDVPAAAAVAAGADLPLKAAVRMTPQARPMPDVRPKPDRRVEPELLPKPSAAAIHDDLRLAPEAAAPLDATDVRSLFDEPQRSSPWAGRLAIIAAIVAVVGGGGWLLLRGTQPQGTPAAAARPQQAATLDLLSLRHTQETGRLTVTGLVQNPRGAAPLARVVATAFVFGPDGTFLASGRAPLDFTSLGGGDESPFVVTIPVSGQVARYRVGFRGEDGTVIAHVDKRAETMAQK
jgi:hypothetical protein